MEFPVSCECNDMDLCLLVVTVQIIDMKSEHLNMNVFHKFKLIKANCTYI